MHMAAIVTATAVVTGALITFMLNFITAERRIMRIPPRWYGTEDADFRRATGVLLGPAILRGNHVEILVNGDAIFPPMLSAINAARASITFETFIYWSGSIGEQFAAALIAAATRGVAVHVLLDWLGSRRIDSTLIARLRAAGIEVRIYHPLAWYHLGRINNRTHRKLLIVDGAVGFTGGVGIANQWLGNAATAAEWRDSHFAVRGPVVAQMQAVFLDNWIKATGEVLHGDNYFPELNPAGDMDAQMFGSSPAGGSDSMHLLVLLAITAARRRIDITNPYFVPDDLTVMALLKARQRNVIVRILVPGAHSDAPLVRHASRAHWSRLLKAGVEIYEFQPTMIHCKSMVIDDTWLSVGSANFDNRSFRLNDEANLNIFSDALARQQTELFELDLTRSRRLVQRRWARRPGINRAVEWLADRLRSQL